MVVSYDPEHDTCASGLATARRLAHATAAVLQAATALVHLLHALGLA